MNREQQKQQEKNVSFETALFRVAQCLTEAEARAERGSLAQAHRFFQLAETYALRCGYIELLSLVWAYDGAFCGFSRASPPSAG